MLRRPALLLLLLLAQGRNFLAAPQHAVFRVSGIVLDSLTGQPLDHTEVSIASTTDAREAQAFLTSSDGRFLFTSLAAGKYSLTAGRSGYVHQNFHQHEGYSTAVAVGPGKNSENIRFPLARSAVITGTITDEWSDPLRGAEVLLFEYSLAGGSRNSHPASQTISDDQGHYRFAHLPPGNYTVMVVAKPWYTGGQVANMVMRQLPQVSDWSRVEFVGQPSRSPTFDVAYPLVFYPHAQSLAEAGKLSLSAGSTQFADFSLHPVPSIHLFIRTPVVPSSGAPDDGTPSSGNVNVELLRKIGGYIDNPAPTRREIAPGLAELYGIPPGEVTIAVTDAQNNNFSVWSQSLELSGNHEVDLSPRGVLPGVSGTVLFASIPSVPQESMEARSVIEQAQGAQGIGEPFVGEQSAREQSDSSTVVGEQMATQLVFRSRKTGESFATYVSNKGTFSMSSGALPAGTYELSFQDFPNLQVSSIEATGAKVSGRTIEISGGQSVKLTVHTAEAKGTVTGFALKNGKPVAGAMIVLVPQDPDQNPSLFHRDQSDSDGSFLMSPLFPGRYTLLAIENGWDLEWASTSVLFHYLPNGIPVDLKPDSTASFSVPVQ